MKEEKMNLLEAKEGYDYLFRKIMKEKAKGLSSLALSFRESAFQNGLMQTPSDQLALDLLCFFAFSNDKEPYKGRECALEALDILKKQEKRFLPDEALSSYELLLLAFSELEDVPNERFIAENASYYAFRCGKKEDSYLYMMRNIELCFRFPEEERKALLPNYETLVMMFGKEKAKEMLSFIEKGPSILYDPIEVNPLFIKVLPRVNEELRLYFVAHPSAFSAESFNAKKKEFLAKEGFLWEAPHKK